MRTSSFVALQLAACVAAGALAGPALADGPPPKPFKSMAPHQWTELPAAPTVIDGETVTPGCSGLPGTDPAYRFWVRRGNAHKVVVFFEGGGACWDSLTCTFPINPALPAAVPQFYKASILPGDTPLETGGLFDNKNPANPVKDWTVVYLPYCTGDLHLGAATRSYLNVGHPVLPLPASYQIHHRGHANFRVVLKWMSDNLPDAHELLVTGSSAGGYGATGNFGWLREAYPKADAFLLADASQGVTTASWDSGLLAVSPLLPGRTSWNMRLPPWIFGNDISALRGGEITRGVAEFYAGDRVGQYTTAWDGVQALFYGVMEQFYPPGGAEPNVCKDWNAQMIDGLNFTAGAANFRAYVGAGDAHTIMRSDKFYTEASAGVGFSGWLAAMLKDGGARRGKGGFHWDNV